MVSDGILIQRFNTNEFPLLLTHIFLNFSSPLQKMSQEFEIKRLSLEEQRDRLQQQLDNLKEELSAKLNMANQEVRNPQVQSSDGDGDDDDVIIIITSLLLCSGVPPPGAGEGGGAEHGFSSDADQLSEGNSGETQDRT